MPPRKLPKKKVIQKQKIAARLIEMSIQVDDCIYKKKTMSVEKATKYKDELTLIEPKCQGDVRSMQVIEKLTNFMKTIIEGQYTTNIEDTSQPPSIAFNVESKNTSLLDSSGKTSRSIQVQTNEPNETEAQALDIYNKEYNAGKSNTTTSEPLIETNEVGVDLERTLSNLSLSIIDPHNNEIDLNVSKGPILTGSINVKEKENFHNSASKIEVIDLTISLSGPDLDPKNIDQIHTSIDLLERNSNVLQEVNNEIQKETNEKSTVIISQNNDLLMDLEENLPGNSFNFNLPLDLSVLEYHTKGTAPLNVKGFNQEAKETVQKNNINTKRNKRKGCLQNAPISAKKESKENVNVNSKTKSKRVYKRENKVETTISKINMQNVTENNKQNKKKRVRKTNKKEKSIDLSWIENIKYLRIIDPLEYDANFDNLPDSFWHDGSLPSNCKDYF